MRKIQNNLLNSELFIKHNVDVSDATTAEFKQLGGSQIVNVPITILFEDCCTVEFQIPLGENAIRNGRHALRILDSADNELFEVTVLVEGNESTTSYMIEDDGDEIDYVYPQPTDITFSSVLITFSNNNT